MDEVGTTMDLEESVFFFFFFLVIFCNTSQSLPISDLRLPGSIYCHIYTSTS